MRTLTTTRRTSLILSTFQRLALLIAAIVLAGCTTLKTPTFTDDGAAIRGYDPVGYHLESRPVKGQAEFSYTYNNAVWQFASRENLELFRDDPEKYAPAYGGYCAYAMSKGFVVSTDPDAWTIDNDKLYLNYSLGVRKTWLKDVPGYVQKADVNWTDKIEREDFE